MNMREAIKSILEMAKWSADFPHVITHTSLTYLQAQPGYERAKKGLDRVAAAEVVKKVCKKDKIIELGKNFPDALLVPASRQDEQGHNLLPIAYAYYIQHLTGLKVVRDVYQASSKIGHTKAKFKHRFVGIPTVGGAVQKDQMYIIVDDVVAGGGTAGAFRDYITDIGGGTVVAVTALAVPMKPGMSFGGVLSPREDIIQKLEQKFGRDTLNRLLKNYNRGTIDELSNSEAKWLLSFGSIDSIRKSLFRAEQDIRQRLV